MIWFLYFLESLLIGIILGLIFLRIKKKINQEFTRRLGGAVVIISVVLTILLNPEIEITRQIFAILIGGVIILFFGIWDDFKKISWKYQLLFQGFLVIFLSYFGFGIDRIKLFGEVSLNLNIFEFIFFDFHVYLVGFIFFALWTIVLMNAINWVDGIDGLSGAISILALFAIFFVSLREEVNQPAIAIISLIVVGSILAFLLFNLYSSILIAGTSGSYFFGFILATLAVVSGTKIAALMLVIVFPLVDAIWVVYDRIRSRKSIFIGENQSRHLHYRLLKLGWSEKKIVFTYVLFLGIILAVDFYLQNRNLKLFLLLVELGVVVWFMFYVYKKELLIGLRKSK